MNNQPGIVKEGWLKRIKNQKKRYFVLCFDKETGAAQLQYYETERKFNSKSDPKRTIYLQDCLGIIRKQDSKFGLILVLYTKDDVFGVTAETEELLESWFSDLDKLHKMENKNLQESKYDLVWNVKVIARGLGGVKNMTGSYRFCLKDDSLYFVNPTTQEVLIEEKLYNVRRYGHMDFCFFMEFGRSTTLGAGEIWMEVEDPLIAQKIHETLVRSVRPASGEKSSASRRPERHSMVINSKNYVEPVANNNNNSSPKPRRLTFFGARKKEQIRTYSKSVSATSHVKTEQEAVTERLQNSAPFNPPAPGKDDECDSEEEGMHYPHITPPVPGVEGTSGRKSFSGSLDEDVHLRNEKKESKGGETKPMNDGSQRSRSPQNDYCHIKPRRRTVVKQPCDAVRKDYAAEKRRSASFPRRLSSTSSEQWRRNSESEKIDDSDKDGSDDGGTFSPGERHYLSMDPRQRIASDSSSDEPSSYVRMRQTAGAPTFQEPPSYVHMGQKAAAPDEQSQFLPVRQQAGTVDVYMKMSSPHTTPKLEKTRHSRSSVLSSDSSYNSPEEFTPLDHDPAFSSYVNMTPGQRQQPRMGSSSAESADETPAADADEETFDHLVRDDHLSNENLALHSDLDQCYVNMTPQSKSSGGLKKSRSQIQRSPRSDYVNVNVNRSKSVGSRSPRPLFEIVPEPDLRPSSGDENGRQSPSSYVNVKAHNMEENATDSNQQYANCVPSPQKSNGDISGRRELNYASVEFSENMSGSRRVRNSGRNSPNYCKIDFQKSKGLADISSSRERQLHGMQ